MPCDVPELDQDGIVLSFPEPGAKASPSDFDPELGHQRQILRVLRGIDVTRGLVQDVQRDLMALRKDAKDVGQAKIASAAVVFGETDMDYQNIQHFYLSFRIVAC